VDGLSTNVPTLVPSASDHDHQNQRRKYLVLVWKSGQGIRLRHFSSSCIFISLFTSHYSNTRHTQRGNFPLPRNTPELCVLPILSLINLRRDHSRLHDARWHLTPGPTHKAEPHPKWWRSGASHASNAPDISSPKSEAVETCNCAQRGCIRSTAAHILGVSVSQCPAAFFHLHFLEGHDVDAAAGVDPATRKRADVSLPDSSAGSLPSRRAI
jgi:hypothetical protein